MRTNQEALRTKKERRHSYDEIGKVRLYTLLRRAVRSYTSEKEKMYRLSGTKKRQCSKCYKGSKNRRKTVTDSEQHGRTPKKKSGYTTTLVNGQRSFCQPSHMAVLD